MKRASGFADGSLPGGVQFAIGLDAAVAAGSDQLGQHVGDFLRPAGVVATLLALAACSEVGGGVVAGVMRGMWWAIRSRCAIRLAAAVNSAAS